jgi:hypothetical protein
VVEGSFLQHTTPSIDMSVNYLFAHHQPAANLSQCLRCQAALHTIDNACSHVECARTCLFAFSTHSNQPCCNQPC